MPGVRCLVVSSVMCTVLAACSAAGHVAGPSSGRPEVAEQRAAPPVSNQVDVGTGDTIGQRFCAVAPATGDLRYVVHDHVARLAIQMGHLPAGRFGVAWATGPVHGGEVLASFRVDQRGRSQPRSVRMFHAPYYDRRGTGIALVTNRDHAVGRLRPCAKRLAAGS